MNDTPTPIIDFEMSEYGFIRAAIGRTIERQLAETREQLAEAQRDRDSWKMMAQRYAHDEITIPRIKS